MSSVRVQKNQSVGILGDGSVYIDESWSRGPSDPIDWPTVFGQSGNVRVLARPMDIIVAGDDGMIEVQFGDGRLSLPKEFGPYSVVGSLPDRPKRVGKMIGGNMIIPPLGVEIAPQGDGRWFVRETSAVDWVIVLQDDAAGADRWLEAARALRLAQGDPSFGSQYGWAVVRLMESRAVEMAAGSRLSGPREKALKMGRLLAAWDGPAGAETLGSLCRNAIETLGDMKVRSLAGALGAAIADRLRLGDESAGADYQAIAAKLQLDDLSMKVGFFAPLVAAPENPLVQAVSARFMGEWKRNIASAYSTLFAGACVLADECVKSPVLRLPAFRGVLVAGLSNEAVLCDVRFRVEGEAVYVVYPGGGYFGLSSVEAGTVSDGLVPMSVGDRIASEVSNSFRLQAPEYSFGWDAAAKASARGRLAEWLADELQDWDQISRSAVFYKDFEDLD